MHGPQHTGRARDPPEQLRAVVDWRRIQVDGDGTPIEALDDRGKLTSDFNEADDASVDEVLGALQSGRIPLDLARAHLAHPIAMMHADRAQAVADYLDRMLAQRPSIDRTQGGSVELHRSLYLPPRAIVISIGRLAWLALRGLTR